MLRGLLGKYNCHLVLLSQRLLITFFQKTDPLRVSRLNFQAVQSLRYRSRPLLHHTDGATLNVLGNVQVGLLCLHDFATCLTSIHP